MMQRHYVGYVFLLLAVPLACTSQVDEIREKKLISTFQIVRFPNDVCIGSNARNGTCYTSAECSDKDGASSGSCADGFGVCCTFVIDTCGQTTSENVTYWTKPAAGATAGTCGLTVCPVSDDICQLRLDFTAFVITGPSTLSLAQVRRMFGQPTGAIADVYARMGSSYSTNCFLDNFAVQGPSPSSTPPIICGTNTGYHMYVEADEDRCNMLKFYFAGDLDAIGVGLIATRGLAALATRNWDITVTQLECTNTMLPPVGCTQYFTTSTPLTAITIRSYNYGTAAATPVTTHLASQHQRICIRRERGHCLGCFSAADADFNISGNVAGNAMNIAFAAGCCGYNTDKGGAYANGDELGLADANQTQFGYDCVIIPGATLPAAADVPVVIQTAALLQQVLLATQVPVPAPPQICGHGKGLGSGGLAANTLITNGLFTAIAGSVVNLTVCTRHVPFTLEFVSDDIEGLGSTAGNTEFSSATQAISNGFSISHQQYVC